MKRFCFTVDDNIRFLREITEGSLRSLFEHPYLAMYKSLHERYGLKVQLNLFFEEGDFNLSSVMHIYRDEWRDASDWLKLSFHSRSETVRPYEHSGYCEVYNDCRSVNREIYRFADPASLAKTTTVHYCLATDEGISALYDNGVFGLLGLYGSADAPAVSYCRTEKECASLRNGETVYANRVLFGAIDIVLNRYSIPEILEKLEALGTREQINIMIHEQYFYPDYPAYQDNFCEKLDAAIGWLDQQGYGSIFFEELLG